MIAISFLRGNLDESGVPVTLSLEGNFVRVGMSPDSPVLFIDPDNPPPIENGLIKSFSLKARKVGESIVSFIQKDTSPDTGEIGLLLNGKILYQNAYFAIQNNAEHYHMVILDPEGSSVYVRTLSGKKVRFENKQGKLEVTSK